MVPGLLSFDEGMERCTPAAHLALMRPLTIVVTDPGIQIPLNLVDGSVYFAPECDLVELLQNSFVEALADTVGLRVVGLGLGVLNIVDRQIQLIVMTFGFAAILSATIGQNTQHPHTLLGHERQHAIIEQIGRRNGRLGRIELGRSPFRVRINECLLINPAHAFDGTNVERILTAQVSRMSCLDFTVRDVVILLSL